MHHAYIYEGECTLLPLLKERVKKDHPQAEVYTREYEKFGVEEARDLNSIASLKIAAQTIWVLAASAITSEAQNALLKLFEEPQPGLVFVVLAPQGSLIATLRSRLLSYPGKVGEEKANTYAKKFLAMPAKLRSAEVTKILKDDEGVRERVREFLDGLESALYQKSLKKSEIRAGLEDIAKVRSYSGDRSPSFKMLLEHLALSLPVL